MKPRLSNLAGQTVDAASVRQCSLLLSTQHNSQNLTLPKLLRLGKTGTILSMTLTRADLPFICSKIVSVAPSPADSDLAALNRAGRYAYNTRYSSLHFSAKPWTAPDGLASHTRRTLIGKLCIRREHAQSDRHHSDA